MSWDRPSIRERAGDWFWRQVGAGMRRACRGTSYGALQWFQQFYAADKLARHRGRALEILRAHGRDLPERAELERRVQKLKRELANATENNHRRNAALDALGFVWCDGGCASGVFRYPENAGREITEEMVVEAERHAQRLRRWWTNHTYRVGRVAA